MKKQTVIFKKALKERKDVHRTESFTRKNKKRMFLYGILIVVILIGATGAVGISVYNYLLKQEREATEAITILENLERIKLPVFEGEITKDLRLHYYNSVKLSNKLEVGDYVDIRIAFANGMDFIVLPKKKIVDLQLGNSLEGNFDNSLWLYVTEEEILRMSSAVVDTNMRPGSGMYAVKYAEDIQETPVANYPVSEEVRKLIDICPNIINKGKLLKESPFRKEIEVQSVYGQTYSEVDEERRESIESTFEENFYEEKEPVFLE